MNLNKVFILGNLTRDPEVRTTPSGITVATFGVATNRIWLDKNGQKQRSTEFHNIVTFGKLAQIAGQYLAKGKLVLIEGRIQTRSWDDQNGQKRTRTEIIAQSFQMGPKYSSLESGVEPESSLPDKSSPTEEIPEEIAKIEDINLEEEDKEMPF
mgnify:CR=1 FL=1